MAKKRSFVSDMDLLVKSKPALTAEYHGRTSQSLSLEQPSIQVNSTSSVDLTPSTKRQKLTVERRPTVSLEDLTAELPLDTFILLVQACRFVPRCFLDKRETLITNIVRAANVHILPADKLSSAIRTIDCSDKLLLLGKPPADILWQATKDSGMPHLHFLGPPSIYCSTCRSILTINNSPTHVVLYTQDGPFPASKIVLRCVSCNLYYHPDMFGNSLEGYRYYDEKQSAVKCTNQAYMERHVCSLIASAG